MSEEANPSPNDSNKAQRKEWTPQDIKALAEAILPLVEKYIQFKKDEAEDRAKRLTAIGAHNRRLSYSLIVFLLVLVGLMAYLTWLGKVSGDALLYLAGTITGYIVIMIQDLTFPLFEEKEPEE